MEFSIRKCALALAMTSVVVGCTSSTSSNLVKTEAIWAEMKVEANGNSAHVGVELNIGNKSGTNVVLVGEDYLEVAAGGQSKRLSQDTDFLDVDYETRINVSKGNTRFTISLHRDDNEVRRSNVELPMGFSILSPLQSDSLRNNSAFNVQIDGSDSASQTSLHLTSHCRTTTGGSYSAHMEETFNNTTSRVYTINQLTIFNDSVIDKSRDCTLDVEIVRTRSGQVASQFANGSEIKARQIRKVEDIEVRLD